MTRHQPLHETTQLRSGVGLHQQVEVVRHQAVTEDLDRMTRSGFSQQCDKRGEVALFVKNPLPPVPPVQDMINNAICHPPVDSSSKRTTQEGQ